MGDDLAALPSLDDARLVRELATRYARAAIYVRCAMR
jgi:hypothetical protein